MKRIFILKNTELGGSLALSVFLTNLLSNYPRTNKFDINLICGNTIENQDLPVIRANLNKIFVTKTSLYKIRDNLVFARKSFKILQKEHKNTPIDIIHCFYPNSSILAVLFFKIFVSRTPKIIYDVRSPRIEMSFANKWISSKFMIIKRFMHIEEFFLVRLVDSFIFVSKGLQKYYSDQYYTKLQKSFVIPSGVNVARFGTKSDPQNRHNLLSSLGISSDTVVVGYVGNLSSMRKISNFISQNIDSISDFNGCFLFIGAGDDIQNIKNILATSQIRAKCIFLDNMPQSQLVKYLDLFDYGLCQYPDNIVFRRCSPLKALEYLASGKKILASNIEAIRELKEDFPDSIILYDDKLDFASLSKQTDTNSPKISQYDWYILAQKYFLIYQSL